MMIEKEPLHDRAIDLAHYLIDRHFSVHDGVLVVDGVAVTELAERYGTPLYVYSQRILERTWDNLRATYPSRFDIYYSMKANPHSAFLNFFLQRGSGVEVASGGELIRAQKAGYAPERIIYAGPGKTDEELELAIIAQIGEIHAESLGEVERISRIGAHADRMMRIALRVNPAPHGVGGAMLMGGKATQFGIDQEQLVDVIQFANRCSHIELIGLHLNTGTQWLDAQTVVDQYRQGWLIASQIAPLLPNGLRTLDFGGGLGIPYFNGETPLNLENLREGLETLVSEINDSPLAPGARLMIEPGRFLVGESGLYLTRVVDMKISQGQRFVIVDGGMNHHAAATGNFGQTIRRAFPLAIVNDLHRKVVAPLTLVGPLCTPLDTYAKNLPWPEVRVGDIIGVFQSGAYARTASPVYFLGHRTPAEIWVDSGQCRVIQPRGEWN